MMTAQIIFWISIVAVLYTYIGHPVLLYVLARLFPRPWRKKDINLATAVYVSAFNEEKALGKKIRNLLEQDYEGDYKIIIANDGSTDKTASIVRAFNSPRIVLYDFKVNRGKSAMQNEVIPQLDCEVVIFSDTTSIWPRDAVKKIVQNFYDPDVGCVSVDICFAKQTEASVEKGQGAYWKYERFLRKYGSLVKTNIVASGTTYAIRRELFIGAPGDVGEDLTNPLNVAVHGKRVVFVPEITIEEKSSTSHDSEYRMRTRIATRNVTGLFKYWRFLNPRYGFASYQLLMHKYMRVLCWVPMFLALIANLALLDKPLYLRFFPFHIGFYILAVSGYVLEKKGKKVNLLYMPYYFFLLNFACMVGFFNYCRGARKVTWTPDR